MIYPNNKMIVKPSKDGIKSFKSKIKEIFKQYNSSPLELLIDKLNPLIKGWAYYYRFVNSKVIFSQPPNYQSETLSNGIKYVARLSALPLLEHIKIVATANPYNKDDDLYFTKRYISLKLRNKFSY